METKNCSTCHQQKPLSEFNRHKLCAGGFNTKCKLCVKSYKRDHYEKNKAVLAEKCAAYYRDNRESIINRTRAYYEKNKDLILQKSRENYPAIADKKRQSARNYRNANRQRIIIAGRTYYKKNRQAISEMRKQSRGKQREKEREYWLKNRVSVLAKNANQRARKRNAPGRYTAADVNHMITMQKSCCAVCRTRLSGNYHVDHIVALANGGTNDKTNLQILCPQCNMSKSARDPVEFMQSRGYLL
jgi:5-methylcytosine-specific restriction endonuclease McrA